MLPKSPLYLLWVSSLSCVIVLLFQSQAFAQGELINLNEIPSYGALLCVASGWFFGGLLTMESRRWRTFFIGLLLLIIGLWAIAFLIHLSQDPLSPFILWRYSFMGLSLGLIPTGLWWWGHRQGYFLAVLDLLFCRDSADPIFKRIIDYHEPDHAHTEASLSVFKRIKYQAAVVRYYRLFDQGELHAVSVLVSDHIQDHWQQKQAQQQAQQKQKKKAAIESLLNQAAEVLDRTS